MLEIYFRFLMLFNFVFDLALHLLWFQHHWWNYCVDETRAPNVQHYSVVWILWQLSTRDHANDKKLALIWYIVYHLTTLNHQQNSYCIETFKWPMKSFVISATLFCTIQNSVFYLELDGISQETTIFWLKLILFIY